MEIPLYLAMTAAEFHASQALPPNPAWMACHFSLYGTGLSNIPRTLPPGSMLMLNDRIPICGHDPRLVAETLAEAAKALGCESIALDFQRESCQQLLEVIQEILDHASCPVGVSALYAGDFDCPVLMPPISPDTEPKAALSAWAGRELWLELSSEGTQITVTEEGSRFTPLPNFITDGHEETELHCHYRITLQEDCVLFHLGRTAEDQAALVRTAASFGATKALGLWQEKSLLQLQQARESNDQPKASSASLNAP